MAPVTKRDLLSLKSGLPLVRGTPQRRVSLVELAHQLWTVLPWLALRLPYIVIFKHLIPWLSGYRIKSQITDEVGRNWFADVIVRFTAHLLSRGTPHQGRLLFFGRKLPYAIGYSDPSFYHYKHLLQHVEEPNFCGRWIADPKTERRDDDMVILNVHGGGFVIDTGGLCQTFWLAMYRYLGERRGRKISIFQPDYELAPEYIWPSQIIEALATYSHLVFKLGISPERICICGDSAGATIILGMLLHIARPNPQIKLPPAFRVDELKRPGACLLISPFVKFVSKNPSRSGIFDDIDVIEWRSSDHMALEYIGGHPYASPGPSFWPHHIFVMPTYDYTIEEPQPFEHGKLHTDAPIDSSDAVATIKHKLRNPYINPSMVNDRAWWKEAIPPKTLVTWGGKEIFSDDIRQFCIALQQSGVPVQRLVKPYGMHDWILYDWTIPFLARTKSNGPDMRKEWGMERASIWLDGCIADRVHGKLDHTEVKAKI